MFQRDQENDEFLSPAGPMDSGGGALPPAAEPAPAKADPMADILGQQASTQKRNALMQIAGGVLDAAQSKPTAYELLYGGKHQDPTASKNINSVIQSFGDPLQNQQKAMDYLKAKRENQSADEKQTYLDALKKPDSNQSKAFMAMMAPYIPKEVIAQNPSAYDLYQNGFNPAKMSEIQANAAVNMANQKEIHKMDKDLALQNFYLQDQQHQKDKDTDRSIQKFKDMGETDPKKVQEIIQNAGPDSDPAQLVKFLVPQHHQTKVFGEIEAAQNTSQNAPKILEAFDNAAKNWHAADLAPGIDNADQKSLHALLGPTFKDVEGTVRQAAMDNMNKNVTPQFGDSKETIAKKRAALIGYLKSKQAAPTAAGYGLNLGGFKSTTVSDGGKTLVKTQTNQKTGQKRNVYSDGTTEIVNGSVASGAGEQ